MNGILPIWKPVEITSYDVIRNFKRYVHPDFKIGHGGTLDPFAEGILLLLLGRATKKMNELSALPKTYRATAILGAKSETLDRTGKIEQCHSDTVSQAQIIEVAQKFVGEIEQEIPDYSATKIGGVPRYKLARAGKEMGKKSKMVTIYSITGIQILKSNGSNHRTKVVFEAEVSSGTYIRQLSYDLFKLLGIESYLDQLVRIKIGDFSKEKCCEISDLHTEAWKDKVLPV